MHRDMCYKNIFPNEPVTCNFRCVFTINVHSLWVWIVMVIWILNVHFFKWLTKKTQYVNFLRCNSVLLTAFIFTLLSQSLSKCVYLPEREQLRGMDFVWAALYHCSIASLFLLFSLALQVMDTSNQWGRIEPVNTWGSSFQQSTDSSISNSPHFVWRFFCHF